MSAVTTNPIPLDQSRDFCARLTKSAARNFYYGLRLLPEPKRSAMFALYAYMRLLDDIADADNGRSESDRLAALDDWQSQTRAAYNGECPAGPGRELWPAFSQLVRDYRIPPNLFDAAIEGQRQDLRPEPFDTFAQLQDYCYRVAGVVGVASIYVWGFDGGDQTVQLAIDRGHALQLTNILRDLREDSDRGRIYFPREDLHQFGLTAADLRSPRDPAAFERFLRFQIDRAQSYYGKSSTLDRRITPDCRPTLWAMTEIYHGVLHKIAAKPLRILSGRVSLSLWTKLRIGWRALRAAKRNA